MVGGEANDAVLGTETTPRKKKKHGGRVKGTPNKATAVRKTAEEILHEMGIDPIQSLGWVLQGLDMATGLPYKKLVAVVEDGQTIIKEIDGYEESTRMTALKELGMYVHPKKKAIEHTGGDGKPLVPPDIHIHFV